MIGPGRLILVVGPSGAGKDTLLAGARAALGENPQVVFPRRVVTRPASEFEDHDSSSEEAFDAALAKGAFAFWWNAHGLRYAIPASIDDDIRAGKSVVCNTSRALVKTLYARYARVAVVLVTAPDRVLAERLAARGRESDQAGSGRLQRAGLFDGVLRPDFVIRNVQAPAAGVEMLVGILSDPHARSHFPAELLF